MAKKSTTTTTSGSTPMSYLVAQAFCAAISFIIVESFWEFQNASEALAFYGVYHRYPWNQLIHFFGVPGILWSLFMFMVHLPFPFSTMFVPGGVDYAFVIAIAYELFYLSIDPVGGTLYLPIIYAMYWSSVKMRQRDQDQTNKDEQSTCSTASPWYGTGRLMKRAAFIHALSWYLQIHLGHQIIEGATPAVFQSLGGALSVAPLFAFYEGLWLLGINRALQNTTLQLVDEYTKEMCTSGDVVMKVCQTLS